MKRPTTTHRLAAQRRAQRVARSRQGAASAALRLFGAGGYNGARTDRPALKNWTPAIGGPNSDTLPDLPALRGRSADLVRNEPLAAGVLATNVTSTVGTGVVPNSRIDREVLGLNDADADAFERDAERIFAWWSEGTACDLAGRLNFFDMQGLALRSTLERGDLFGIHRMVDRKGDLLSTRMQLIEADRVQNPTGQVETDRFMGGIEFDKNGVQIRVHIRDEHPGESTFGFATYAGNLGSFGRTVAENVYGAKTGRRRVLHIMDTTRIGQVRGVPYLAPVMEALKQIGRYTEAEIMAAVVNSFLTIFVKTESGDDGLTDMGDPNTLAAAQSLPLTQNDVRLAAGAVVGLGPGESIEQTNVSRPNPQFDPFIQAVLRQIGVALEVPFELLIKHFTASYSASRAAMIEGWRSTSRRRTWLVRSFCQPAWEWVMEEAIARGLLKAPGFFDDALIRQAYVRAEWTGPAMGSLDPESDVDAAKKRIELGASTHQQETAQLTGGDWMSNHPQLVKEHRMRVRDGLDVEETAERIVTEPKNPEPREGSPEAPDPDDEPDDEPDGNGEPEDVVPSRNREPGAKRVSRAKRERELAIHE